MEETTMSAAFKDATDKLHDRIVALGEEAGRRVRKTAPRVRKALDHGYDETVDAVGSLARNRTAQVWIAVGVLGLVAGLFLSRRR